MPYAYAIGAGRSRPTLRASGTTRLARIRSRSRVVGRELHQIVRELTALDFEGKFDPTNVATSRPHPQDISSRKNWGNLWACVTVERTTLGVGIFLRVGIPRKFLYTQYSSYSRSRNPTRIGSGPGLRLRAPAARALPPAAARAARPAPGARGARRRPRPARLGDAARLNACLRRVCMPVRWPAHRPACSPRASSRKS